MKRHMGFKIVMSYKQYEVLIFSLALSIHQLSSPTIEAQ